MAHPALQEITSGLAALQRALLEGELETAHGQLVRTLDALAEVARAGLVARQKRATSPWDEAQATRLLWQLLARLRAAGCHVFPYAGTLLGLERSGRLLPNDKDTDLAVWLEDFALAGAVLQQLGLQRATDMPPFDNVATYVEPASACSVDLFGLRRVPGEQRVEGGAWLYGRPASHQRVLVLPWIHLAGRAGPAGPIWWPEPADALLAAFYGSDWRTPQPHWDSLVSNCAVQDLNLNWRCFALKNLVQSWLGGDAARTLRLLAQIDSRAGADPQLRRWREALER